MDTIDRNLLNMVQKGIPIAEHPFHMLAKELEIEPGEVVSRLEGLKKEGYIRRIGGVFNSAKMGYTSMLFAMEVPEELFYETARVINEFDGVTHNYRRNSRLNMWFTLSTADVDERNRIIDCIRKRTHINKIHIFPAEKHFKLEVSQRNSAAQRPKFWSVCRK